MKNGLRKLTRVSSHECMLLAILIMAVVLCSNDKKWEITIDASNRKMFESSSMLEILHDYSTEGDDEPVEIPFDCSREQFETAIKCLELLHSLVGKLQEFNDPSHTFSFEEVSVRINEIVEMYKEWKSMKEECAEVYSWMSPSMTLTNTVLGLANDTTMPAYHYRILVHILEQSKVDGKSAHTYMSQYLGMRCPQNVIEWSQRLADIEWDYFGMLFCSAVEDSAEKTEWIIRTFHDKIKVVPQGLRNLKDIYKGNATMLDLIAELE